MKMHKSARLTPSGRALLAERIEAGFTPPPDRPFPPKASPACIGVVIP
jgi:hypothetical protein